VSSFVPPYAPNLDVQLTMSPETTQQADH
jgi:hypothetical protein